VGRWGAFLVNDREITTGCNIRKCGWCWLERFGLLIRSPLYSSWSKRRYHKSASRRLHLLAWRAGRELFFSSESDLRSACSRAKYFSLDESSFDLVAVAELLVRQKILVDSSEVTHGRNVNILLGQHFRLKILFNSQFLVVDCDLQKSNFTTWSTVPGSIVSLGVCASHLSADFDRRLCARWSVVYGNFNLGKELVSLTGPRVSRDRPGRGGRFSLMLDADGVLTDIPGVIPASSFSLVSETDRLRILR